MSSLASHVVERCSWLVQPAAASWTRSKPRAGAVSGGAQSIRKLRGPTGLFWAGVGVGICDMAPHFHLFVLGGRVATQAMISPGNRQGQVPGRAWGWN